MVEERFSSLIFEVKVPARLVFSPSMLMHVSEYLPFLIWRHIEVYSRQTHHTDSFTCLIQYSLDHQFQLVDHLINLFLLKAFKDLVSLKNLLCDRSRFAVARIGLDLLKLLYQKTASEDDLQVVISLHCCLGCFSGEEKHMILIDLCTCPLLFHWRCSDILLWTQRLVVLGRG